MVDWIDEPDDEEDEEETFNCPSCNSALGFDEGDICPVCGEPLDDAEPDAADDAADVQAVTNLQRIEDEIRNDITEMAIDDMRSGDYEGA